MAELVASAEAAAPAPALWAVLEDPRRLVDVSPSTVEVRVVPARLTGAGQGFTQVVAAGDRRVETVWEVAEIQPGRRLVLEGKGPYRVRFRLDQWVEDTGPGRSRVHLRMEYRLPLGPLGRLAARMGIERQAAEEVEQVLANVAAVAEGRAPTDRLSGS